MEYTPYVSPELIDIYQQYNSDNRNIPYNDNRNIPYNDNRNITYSDNRNITYSDSRNIPYSDNHDYWRYYRYHNRGDLLERPIIDERPLIDNQRIIDNRDNHGYLSDNNAQRQIWYTRQTIEYADNNSYKRSSDDVHGEPQILYTRQIIDYGDTRNNRSSYDNNYVGDARHHYDLRARERLVIVDEPPPREAIPIIDYPPEEPVSLRALPPPAPIESVAIVDEPQIKSVAFVDRAPTESYAATSQKVIVDFDHEPEYVSTDLGFYSLDDAEHDNSSLIQRRIRDNIPYVQYEPVYARPFKSNAKVSIVDGEGHSSSGNYGYQAVLYRRGRAGGSDSGHTSMSGSYMARADERFVIGCSMVILFLCSDLKLHQ